MTNLNIVIPIERECTACGIKKPIADFYKDKRVKSGIGTQCKPCMVDKNRRYFTNLPPEAKEMQRARFQRGEYNRSAMYKKTYGLTLEDVRKMHQNQMGLCGNRGCGIELDVDAPRMAKNKAVVDHCHTTGKVRGLLCFKCNTSLGLLEDKNVVLGLTEYLQKYDQKFAFDKGK